MVPFIWDGQRMYSVCWAFTQWLPRITGHGWIGDTYTASITTATPAGSSASEMAEAICFVKRSWTVEHKITQILRINNIWKTSESERQSYLETSCCKVQRFWKNRRIIKAKHFICFFWLIDLIDFWLCVFPTWPVYWDQPLSCLGDKLCEPETFKTLNNSNEDQI